MSIGMYVSQSSSGHRWLPHSLATDTTDERTLCTVFTNLSAYALIFNVRLIQCTLRNCYVSITQMSVGLLMVIYLKGSLSLQNQHHLKKYLVFLVSCWREVCPVVSEFHSRLG